VNEVLQWAFLFTIGILILGLFRQVSLTLPPSQKIPGEGPPLGRQVPRILMREIANVMPTFKAVDGVIVAFVAESCTGCQRLLADLSVSSADFDGRISLVVRQPTQRFWAALEDLHVPIIADSTGELWKQCHIGSTPLVLFVDRSGKVVRKEVTHDVRQVAFATG
jgi:hypothetical protein